ncbi:sigma-70 family RNA polymerase sigma factor [Calothrix sp. UHCC 0171]|uniref:sigma-70 family RNA polymerase sigma factor n=1 Tax=Calothrix sp. UHCC 0171 TaxID=3110245 RepID=UPI002B22076B|nr:sigma-70 family RNA polymerase sigma factor [Calothrix sp. UHCC 0171]MEA5573005.1 sigma-70 family RNA polymerase sigma factor [Calothrix sp. UHCC 0171]
MLNQIPTLPNPDYFVQRFYLYMVVDQKVSRAVIQWKPELHLQRNIKLYQIKHDYFSRLLNQGSDARKESLCEHEMVQFWIDMALNDFPAKQAWEPENRVKKAWEHLTLYCEESCYRAASQVWKDSKYHCWEEYIFLARCLIYNTEKFQKILAKYDTRASSLHTYMTEVLRKTIKDEGVVAKFSKWRLLSKKSSKELSEALIRYGIFEPEISRFLFARKYFKQVYQINKIQNPANRSGQRWVEPDSNDFQEAARCYNGEKNLAIAPHQVAAGKKVTGEELQAWMEICIAALQKYPNSINPSISLEVLSASGREIEFVGVSHPSRHLEFEDSSLEPGNICKQTETVLITELLALNPDQQELLYLYYGLGWNQKEIAAKFAVTQSAIARRLQTIEKRLVNTLYTLKSPPQWVTSYVKTWLESSYETPKYTDLIHVVLVATIKKLDVKVKDLLHMYYGQKLDVNIICDRLGITLDEVTEYLQKTQYQLETALIQEIDVMLKKYLNIWLRKMCKHHISKPNQKQNILETIC